MEDKEVILDKVVMTKKAKKAKKVVIESYKVTKQKFEIEGVAIKNGFILSDTNKANAKFMKRFNYAIQLGLIYV